MARWLVSFPLGAVLFLTALAFNGISMITTSPGGATMAEPGEKAKAPSRQSLLPYPPTPRRPVTDVYHGVKVTEDYRWLENWDDPEVKRWSEAQNRVARSYLDRLSPVAALRKRLIALEGSESPDYFGLRWRGGTLFAMKTRPPKEQAFLVRMKSADEPASERVIVDPNTIDAKGGTAIDFYVPSLDGRLVAVSQSQGGSEDGCIHVYETAT